MMRRMLGLPGLAVGRGSELAAVVETRAGREAADWRKVRRFTVVTPEFCSEAEVVLQTRRDNRDSRDGRHYRTTLLLSLLSLPSLKGD